MPSFCNYPPDTAQSFKKFEEVLCSVLREEHEPGKPNIRGIICSGLHILIKQNREILENKNISCDPSEPENSIARERILAQYTPQFATDNLSALKKSARGFLRVLSGVFLQSGKDDGGWLQVFNHNSVMNSIFHVMVTYGSFLVSILWKYVICNILAFVFCWIRVLLI